MLECPVQAICQLPLVLVAQMGLLWMDWVDNRGLGILQLFLIHVFCWLRCGLVLVISRLQRSLSVWKPQGSCDVNTLGGLCQRLVDQFNGGCTVKLLMMWYLHCGWSWLLSFLYGNEGGWVLVSADNRRFACVLIQWVYRANRDCGSVTYFLTRLKLCYILVIVSCWNLLQKVAFLSSAPKMHIPVVFCLIAKGISNPC